MKTIRIAIAMLAASVLGACSGQAPAPTASEAAMTAPGATMHIEPGRYAATFDQSRDVLRDLGFILDRVDAQQGVIATMPKGTGGLATPWDQEQSGLGDRAADAVQKHRRVVRIEFAPAGIEPGSAEVRDLRTDKRPLEAQVSVTVYQINQPGWRLNTQAILESTYTHDPQLDARGMGVYSVAVRRDDDLARRIAERVRERLDRQTAGR